MAENRFAAFTDEELVDIANAIDMAAGEGGFNNADLAEELVADATRRGIELELGYVPSLQTIDEIVTELAAKGLHVVQDRSVGIGYLGDDGEHGLRAIERDA